MQTLPDTLSTDRAVVQRETPAYARVVRQRDGWFIRRRVAITVWLIVIIVGIVSLMAGWQLRRQTFDVFDAIHFENDIRRGSMWGMVCTGPGGYLNQYDKMAIQQPDWNVWLDYAPLRLLLMTRWADWIRHEYPDVAANVRSGQVYDTIVPQTDRGSGKADHLERSFQFHRPLLLFNATLDFIGAIAAFALTRLWVRRSTAAGPDNMISPFCGLWQGVAAGLILWLNPAVLVNAYAWPTWDAWVIPFFLLAALAASLNFWFVAGLVFGIGTMLKGQQLAVAPAFVAWALVAGGLGPVLRMAGGLAVSMGVIACPWTLSFIPPDTLARLRGVQAASPVGTWPNELYTVGRSMDWPAIMWVLGLASAVTVATVIRRWTREWATLGRVGAALVVAIAAAWPWVLVRNRDTWIIGVAFALGVAAMAVCFRGRRTAFLLAGAIGAMLLASPLLFHGSTAWWVCAFRYGQIQFPEMIYGPASNLPGLLEMRFGWPAPVDAIAFRIQSLGVEVTTKQMFNGIYSTLLIASGIAIGLHARRADRRVLLAITLPWLLFFMLMVGLHERYLLFAAGAAAICVGYSVGTALLGLILSLASAVMTLHQTFGSAERLDRWGQRLSEYFPLLCTPQAGRTVHRYVTNSHPDIAWGLLLILCVYLYVVAVPLPGLRMGRAKRADD